MIPATLNQFLLGIDAGGTQTRLALLSVDGESVETGHAAGLSGMQMQTYSGCATVQARLAEIANQLMPLTCGSGIRAIVAGFTGVDAGNPDISEMLSKSLNVLLDSVRVVSDINIAYHAAFPRDKGCLMYACYIARSDPVHSAMRNGRKCRAPLLN